MIFQWNCMARSISIDHIGFTNRKRGTDYIIVKYNETKSDKTGERCTNKNVYANPTDPSIYFFTALGIHCSYESNSLITKEGFFLKENAKLSTAAYRFCNSLQKLIENYAVVFRALGIHCSYESNSLITREGIFLKKNAKLSTAVHRFCNSLQKLIENYAVVVDGYVCSSHANINEIR